MHKVESEINYTMKIEGIEYSLINSVLYDDIFLLLQFINI